MYYIVVHCIPLYNKGYQRLPLDSFGGQNWPKEAKGQPKLGIENE